MAVSPPLAGELLAHDIIALLCEDATPGVNRSPVVPFAWLCLAEDGFNDPSMGTVLESAKITLASQWATRTSRKTRSKSLKSVRRTNPPAFVIISSGEETLTSNAVAHWMAETMIHQQMISPYAGSIVKNLNDNPGWLRDEKQHNPHALRRLERLVVRDVSEGNLQSHAVVVFDGDNFPHPIEEIEETVDVALALTCMSQETQLHPALQGHRKNLFVVDVEKL